jgi:hypothetical protein
MTILQIGLFLNFIGSILLGLNIFGIERIKKIESKIVTFPTLFSRILEKEITSKLFLGIFSKPSGRIEKLKALSEELKNTKITEYHFPSKIKFRGTLLSKLFVPVIKTFLILIPFYIIFWAIAFIPFLIIKLFSLLKQSFQAENLLGLIGLLLLAIGFIFQFIYTFK